MTTTSSKARALLKIPLLIIPFMMAAYSSSQADARISTNSIIGGCPLFPSNNVWNTKIDNLSVHPRSSQWVNSIGANTGFHMDFGSGTWDGGPIGIPYNVANGSTPKYSVSFLYWRESDTGPYPIPNNYLIEYGSDRHILVVDSSTCKLYELYDADGSGGTWEAGSGAIWDLNSNALRPDTWTSADAAGLPILPGLVRYEEIASGEINHAIRFTASRTNGYIWPARHLTSDNPSQPHVPPMGARFRLKSSYNISGYPAEMQVILRAMKAYGIILADNGSNWYISGSPSEQFDNDMLHLLDDLTGSDFEAVNSSELMIDYNSGAAVQPVKTISGNAAMAGVTLTYTDVTQKTVTTLANGDYSVQIPNNWSGTITPTHACYTFSPSSRSYTNVIADQTGQNYTRTLIPASGCTNINVLVEGNIEGISALLAGASTRQSYSGVNNGPVEVESDTSNIIAAERVIYTVNGVSTSFSESMALPASQLSTTYWLPWYNNVDLDTQLRFGNVSGAPASVRVYIGGTEMTGSPFALTASGAGQSTRVSFSGINNGPVRIVSNQPIVAAERVIYKVNGVNTSFSEMMALPASQLGTTYWLPWYNNVDLDTQLRIGNVSGAPASVRVYIGGTEMTGSPFALTASGAGQSTRVSFSGINNGPVRIVSDQPIVAAERVIYNVNGVGTSFSEMMALPASQLSTTYWLPWYNNVDLDTQLRVGNVSGSTATVRVYIGGTEMSGSPFTLTTSGAGQSTRISFSGINNGPVQIVSNQAIVAAERVIYNVNSLATSFSEMMALPNGQLDTTYWLPWYNNVDLDTQIRFGRP